MAQVRSTSLWFLGAMLGLPAIEFAASKGGLDLLAHMLPASLMVSLYPVLFASAAPLYLALGLGTFVVAVLSFVAVGWWRAPGYLWFVALATSAVQFAWAIASLDPIWSALGTSSAGELVSMVLRTMAGPFSTAPLYFGAAVGYLAAAALGCGIGSLVAGRATATK